MTETAPATILIVDDDRGLVRLIEKTLKREGFVTFIANSGREAINWLVQHTANLMLLDLKLQDMEGKELVSHLHSINRSLPFIIITGQGDERVAVEMMKRGALDYLVKDVRFVEFIPTVVRRVLEKLETDRRLAAAQVALEESQKQVLTVSEREQTRFGAELHDGLGQQLTAIELMCQSLKEDLPANRPDLEKQISRISLFLREATALTRSLARSLSPVQLDSGGLAEALSGLAARINDTGHIKCSFEQPLSIMVEDNLVAGHLFRIAQEAINNAVKHSGASAVMIRLRNSGGRLNLEISDNGQGLPKTLPSDQGIGLQIMKHRASVIGGELQIISKPGKGVTVTCALPAKP